MTLLWSLLKGAASPTDLYGQLLTASVSHKLARLLDASTQGYAPYAYGHLGYGYGHLGYYGKRSADAEADPYYLGGYAYAGVPFGSSTGLDPITQGLDASTQGYAPYAYGHLGYAHGYLGHYYG